MSLKQSLEEHGATPGKLALIGVLSLVLVVVVVKQLPNSGKASPVPKSAPSARQQVSVTQSAEETNLEKNRELPQWPELKLATAIAYDPFVLPHWARSQENDVVKAGEVQDDLSEMKQQGASVVVIGKTVKSASIGDRRYYVGDILEGYRVTDITAEGILLNKMESP